MTGNVLDFDGVMYTQVKINQAVHLSFLHVMSVCYTLSRKKKSVWSMSLHLCLSVHMSMGEQVSLAACLTVLVCVSISEYWYRLVTVSPVLV